MLKWARNISVGFVGLAVLLQLYAAFGPWYDTKPLAADITSLAFKAETHNFSVQVTDTYEVAVFLENCGSQPVADSILGGNWKHDRGSLQIKWRIQQGQRFIAGNSSVGDTNFSRWLSRPPGASVGRLGLTAWQEYSITYRISGVDSSWTQFKPQIRVWLPMAYEMNEEYSIIAALLFVPSVLFAFVYQIIYSWWSDRQLNRRHLTRRSN